MLLPTKVPLSPVCNNPSPQRERIPWESLSRCAVFTGRRIGREPCALIVSAVLLRNITVSLLDRWVRFDYPKRALAGYLLKKEENPALSHQTRREHRRSALGPEVVLATTRQFALFRASQCVMALQLMLHL
jgi:hypothetical protein